MPAVNRDLQGCRALHEGWPWLSEQRRNIGGSPNYRSATAPIRSSLGKTSHLETSDWPKQWRFPGCIPSGTFFVNTRAPGEDGCTSMELCTVEPLLIFSLSISEFYAQKLGSRESCSNIPRLFYRAKSNQVRLSHQEYLYMSDGGGGMPKMGEVVVFRQPYVLFAFP